MTDPLMESRHMTSFAPIPEPDEIPEGFMHVGWFCAAQRLDGVPDGCLMPLHRADSEPRDGEVHLWDANHHGHWEPVYVRRDPSWKVET